MNGRIKQAYFRGINYKGDVPPGSSRPLWGHKLWAKTGGSASAAISQWPEASFDDVIHLLPMQRACGNGKNSLVSNKLLSDNGFPSFLCCFCSCFFLNIWAHFNFQGV